MLRVGLTGGIGAGKSTVAARLVEHGAVLIDSDVIAREVVAAGTEGLAEVVAAFGEGVLAPDGTLDRPALARIVFGDQEALARLNGIVHPRVRARSAELTGDAAPDAVLVHDVPLLVENGMAAAFHLVLVVDAPVETRVRRLLDRGLTEDDARARIATQATDEQRRAAADVWLDNSGWPEEVQAAADALWADRLVPFEANLRLRRPAVPIPPPAAAEPRVPATAVAPPSEYSAQSAVDRLTARVRLALGEVALRVDGTADELRAVVRAGADLDAVTEALAGIGFPPTDDATAYASADPGRPAVLRVTSDDARGTT